jgi:hypothetical protein
MIEHGNKNIHTITYTLDAHGNQLDRQIISPPLGVHCVFYSKPGVRLCLPARVKTQICNNANTHIGDVREMVENYNQAAIGLPFATRPRVSEINYTYNCNNYMYTPDPGLEFYSGLKDCLNNRIIINIDNDYSGGVRLSDIFRILNEYHRRTYSEEYLAQLHILTCRSTDSTNPRRFMYSNGRQAESEPGGPPQQAFGQPAFTPSQGFGQPVFTPPQGFGQPVFTPSQGFGQPVFTPSQGFGPPVFTPPQGFGQPVFTPPQGFGQPVFTPHQGFGHSAFTPSQGFGQLGFTQPQGFGTAFSSFPRSSKTRSKNKKNNKNKKGGRRKKTIRRLRKYNK